VSIAAEYAHPIEFAISNHWPFFSGLFLLGSKTHFSVLIIWSLFRLIETTDDHSGYEFPWSVFRLLPFGGDATYHDFHHSKNVGNYGSFTTIWDSLFNTNKEFYEAYPENSRKH
jgi:sterol desaturase/sphingolipid hydroxylase (fatty acid hydroxylase superfamily)